MSENRIPVSSYAWKWVKQYKIASITKIPNLIAHIQTDIEPWLKMWDDAVKAEFWLTTFKPKTGDSTRLLVILLDSDGDPWEGRGNPGDPGYIPPIPNLAKFVEADYEGGLSLETSRLYEYPPS
jgi:hypothetical protein